jgi:hypothetical protein
MAVAALKENLHARHFTPPCTSAGSSNGLEADTAEEAHCLALVTACTLANASMRKLRRCLRDNAWTAA